jgi:hypothetical protein
MKKYDGEKLTVVEYAQCMKNHNNVTSYKLIRESGERIELDATRRKEATDILRKDIKTAKRHLKMNLRFSIIFAIFCLVLGGFLIAVEAIIAILSCIAGLAMFCYGVFKKPIETKLSEANFELFSKSLAAFESGKYEAYSLDITRKVHCIFDEGKNFYIQCGDNVSLNTNEENYTKAKDRIIFVPVFDDENNVTDILNLP